MPLRMKTSPAGIRAISLREGVRLRAYRDSVGIWTIGVGHTSAAGPPKVTPSLRITQAECDEILSRDLRSVEASVNDAVHVPLNQSQFDALVSFTFNIGAAGLRRSRTLALINARKMDAGGRAMMGWVKPPELRKRRQSEVNQFLGTAP